MQTGYNHKIRHKGKSYHLQTEDSGKPAMNLTTFLFCDGAVIAYKKTSYKNEFKDIVGYYDYTDKLRNLMKRQHKQMLIDLKNGVLDDPELAKLEESEDVKTEEDKTILDAIEETEKLEPGVITPIERNEHAIKAYTKTGLGNKEELSRILKEGERKVVKAEGKIEAFGTAGRVSIENDKVSLRNVELIKSLEVDVKIKLGDNIMPLKKIIKLTPGAIIELNKDVDSLLELVVNDKPIAEGVLVVVSSNNFALRITNILDKSARIRRLGGLEED